MRALAEITRDALALPEDQRRALARILLEVSDMDKGFSPDADAEWEREICRRIEAVRNGTAASRGLEEVFAELDRRFPS
jgi:hypothetical protein